MTQVWANAVGVLQPKTLRQLEANLGREGRAVVDGWAGSNPNQVRKWEKEGTLLDKAKEAQDQQFQAEQMARDQGQTHLSGGEIAELYGGPILRL